ncbi:MAG: hypothetical protein K9N62_06230 [Verrucomicrobia bacterium]|nr:hypothetical protein [Verrucomicrobiota bacterium]
MAQTPLMLARKRGETSIVAALRHAGAREVKPLPGKPAAAPARTEVSSAETDTIIDAVRRALPPLQRSAVESTTAYLRHVSNQDCVSCHQQSLPLAAIGVARSRHFAVNEAALSQMVADIERFAVVNQELNLEATFHPAPAIQKGMEYLLRTQLADGTWYVRTRRHPFQPPMESSFPHGKDGWIWCAATSWAVMALASALDPTQVPATTVVLAKVAKPVPVVTAPVLESVAMSVEFTRDIQPLLERSCVACHSGEKPKGGFAMIDRASLLKGGKRGETVVVPGEPEASPLLQFVQDLLCHDEFA